MKRTKKGKRQLRKQQNCLCVIRLNQQVRVLWGKNTQTLQGQTDTPTHGCTSTPSHTQYWTTAGQKNEGLLQQAERVRAAALGTGSKRMQLPHYSSDLINSAETIPVINTSSSIPPFQILSFYTIFVLLGSFSFQPLLTRLQCALEVLLSQAGAFSCCSAGIFFAYPLLFFRMLKGAFSPLSVLYVFSDQ